LSVWGSDVYDFPYQSSFKMKLLQKNLRAADLIASTSHVMAKQTNNLCAGLSKIHITPFGVDTTFFNPSDRAKSNDTLTIGTIKSLTFKYGIDTLIKGFAGAYNSLKKHDEQIAEKLHLLIVGDGNDRRALEELACSLNIDKITKFIGAVVYSSVSDYLHKLDIYVAVSRLDSESFGVAIVEASACALPVIVSDVGGLPEVVSDGVSGIIIPCDDSYMLAKMLEKLILNRDLRKRMGQAGLERVIEKYTWEESVSIMENLYAGMLL